MSEKINDLGVFVDTVREKRHNGERREQRSKGHRQRGGDIASQLTDLTGSEKPEEISANINGERQEVSEATETVTIQEIVDQLSTLTKEENDEAQSIIDEAVRQGYIYIGDNGNPTTSESRAVPIIRAESQRLIRDKLGDSAKVEESPENTSPIEKKPEDNTVMKAEGGEPLENKRAQSEKIETPEVQVSPRIEKAKAEIAKARERIQIIEDYKEKLRKEDKFSDAILEIERQKTELLAQDMPDEEEISRIEQRTELSLKIIDLMRQQGNLRIEYQELLDAEELANQELEKALKELEDAEIDEALNFLGKADIRHNYSDKEIMAIATNPNTSLAVLLGLTKGLSKDSVEQIKLFVEQGDKQGAVDLVRDELYTRYFMGQESTSNEENYKTALSSEASLVDLIKLLDSEELRNEVMIALKNGVISISTDGEIVSNIENDEGNVDYVNDLKERVLNTFRDEYHKEIYTTLVDDFKKSDKLYQGISEKIKELRGRVRGKESFTGRAEKVGLYLFDRGRFEELSQVQIAESEIKRLVDFRELYLQRHKDIFEKTAGFRLEMFEQVTEGDFEIGNAFEFRSYARELISEEKILREDDVLYMKESGVAVKLDAQEVNIPYLVSQLAEKFTDTERVDIAKKYVREIKNFIQNNSDIMLSDQEFESFLIRSSAFEDLKDLAVLAEGIPKFLQEHTDSHNFSTETVRFALTEFIQTQTSLDNLKTVILREFATEWSNTRFDLLVEEGVFLQEFIKGFDFPQEEHDAVITEAQQVIEKKKGEVIQETEDTFSEINMPSEPSYVEYESSDVSDSIPVRSNLYSNLKTTTEGLNTARRQKGRKKSIWADLMNGFFSLFGGGKN